MADTMPWEDFAKTEEGPWNDFKSADKPTVADPAASVADLEDIKQKAKAVGEDAQSSPILNATPRQAANIPITKALPQGVQNLLREAILPPGLKEAGEMLPGKAGQIVRGATEGGQDVAESFTSPVGILTMAAKAPKAIQGVLGAAFSIMGAQQAGEAGGQLVEAYKKGDWQNVAKLATQVVGGVGQAAIGAHQGMGGVKGTINQIRGIPEGADILPRAKQAAEAVATEKAQGSTPPPIPKAATEAGTPPPVPQTPPPDTAAPPPPASAPLNPGGALSDLSEAKQAQSNAVKPSMQQVFEALKAKQAAQPFNAAVQATPENFYQVMKDAGFKGATEWARDSALKITKDDIPQLELEEERARREEKDSGFKSQGQRPQYLNELIRTRKALDEVAETKATTDKEIADIASKHGVGIGYGGDADKASELKSLIDKQVGTKPPELGTKGVEDGTKPPIVGTKPAEPAVKESALDPQHQEWLDKDAPDFGHKVKVETGAIGEGHPLAGAMATIDRKTGETIINPKELSYWLKNNVPEGKERTGIRSVLGEEQIHHAVDDKTAKAYHDAHTGLEQAIAQRVYGGKGGEKLSPTMLGHEMLRMRMQQLARMDVRETLEKSLKERWTVKSLLAASDAIRTIRETIGTKASKEGGAITDRIQDNLDAAIAAKSGEAPAATRKGVEEEPDENLTRALGMSVDRFNSRNVSGYNQMLDAKVKGESTTKNQSNLGELTKSPSLFHETSLDSAYAVYQGLLRPFKQSWTRFMVADNPDIALGQSGKGVLFELEPTKVNGYEHEKPGTGDISGREFSIDRSIRKSVKSVTFATRRQMEAFQKRFPKSLDYENATDTERGIKVERKQAQPQTETPAATRKGREETTPEFFLPPIKEPGERASASDLGALPEQKIPPEEGLHVDNTAWNKGTAWRRVQDVPTSKPLTLGKMLTQGSRESSSDPVSMTKRLVALEKNGKVDVVSIYHDATDGARAVDPLLAGKRERPNVPLKALLDEGYKPIASMLRTEPVQNFHRHFDSLDEFNDKVGTPHDVAAANRPHDAGEGVDVGFEDRGEGEPAKPMILSQPNAPQTIEGVENNAKAAHRIFSKAASPDAVVDAIQSAPNKRQILAHLTKAIKEAMASDPSLTPLDAVKKVSAETYEQAKSQTESDFIQRFSAEAGEDVGHPDAAGTAEEESSPAAINKHSVKAVAQIAQDEAELMKQNIGDFMALGPTKHNLASSVDSASNTPGNIGHQAGTDVRLASASKPTGKLAQMADWKKGKMEVLRAANVLVESGAIAKGGRFDPVMKGQIPVFQEMVESRRQAAEALLKTGDAVERRAAAAWIRQAAEYTKELDYAEKHWNDPELVETARRAKAQGDAIWKRLIADGVDVKYDQNHLPHRYDASIGGDESALFKLVNGSEKIIGRNFRDMKKYDTVYAAFKGGGFIPVTRDIASLTEHMVTQGETLIAKRAWRNGLNDVEMPDGNKMRVDTEKGADGRQIAPRGYKLVGVNGEYMAIHEDAAGLIKNLTEDSKYNMAERPWRTRALRAEQMLKHTLLIGDLFHMGRMMAYSLSINGLKGPGFNAALSIMDIPKNRMAEAVSKGWLSKDEADWGSTRIKYGGETITRRELGEKFVRQMGSNVGKIQDALYKDLITQHTAATSPTVKGIKTALDPSFGRYNRFLFDKFTRGLMMEANIMEFERQTKANPHLNPDNIAQDISHDVNVYFGNIGRQGLLTSATDRDTARLLALAPQWMEGLVTKELTAYSRASGASKLLGQRKGVTNLGTTGRGLARGLIFMLGLTQAANLITRKQFTWQNEEKDEKWSAYIGNKEGDGVFLNPWSLFNEITSDAWDYAHARDKTTIGAINQIVGNHESPLARAVIIGVLGAQAGMQKSTSSMGQLKQAGEQLVPAPISFGALGRAAGHAVAANLIAPNKPGVALQRGLATFGLKTKIAESPMNRMTGLAQTFSKENGFHVETGWQQQATDEASYSKLKSALRDNDQNKAKEQYEALLKRGPSKDVEEKKIFRVMKMAKKRPFTGNSKAEHKFVNSLDDNGLALYQKALEQREKEYQSFEDFVLRH